MISILLIGLDNSGKSTMLGHFKEVTGTDILEIFPTFGLAIHEIVLPEGKHAIVYDCGGGYRYRNMWDHFAGECSGIVFVIDCTDKDRAILIKDQIQYFFTHPLLKEKPVAFFLNKYDQLGSISKEDLKVFLEINKQKIAQPFKILLGNSMTGENVFNCFNFISEKSKDR
jgi:small GTP-binding protein